MSRIGKIARIPREIRDRLNSRLDDGETGTQLVEWLNSLPEVQQVLLRDFEGRPVNEQNLTQWKQGGFLDWRSRQEARESVSDLMDFSDDIEDSAYERGIPDRLAAALAAEVVAEAQTVLRETTDPMERWRIRCDTLRLLNDMRQRDHAAFRATIERERWEIECNQRQDEKLNKELSRAREEATNAVWKAINRPMLIKTFGGGKQGAQIVDLFDEIDEKYTRAKYDRSDDEEPNPDSPPTNQTESNQQGYPIDSTDPKP